MTEKPTSTIKAYGIGPQNGLDGLHLQDIPEPVARKGEVVVRVLGAGLNYRDLMLLDNNYGPPQPAERVPLSDGVGVVESVGEGVSGFQLGDRVIAPNFALWLDGPFSPAVFGQDLGISANGWLAEKRAVPANAAIKVPDNISIATAATLSVVGATVWHSMISFGEAKPGDLVLAQGTGGVSIFTLLLAKASGMRFAITSSSDVKLEKCRAMGADYTVNYRTHADWPAAMMEATGGRGADVVVDTLGFATIGQAVAASATNARIATLGNLSGGKGDTPAVSQGEILAKNITIKGVTSGSRAMLERAVELISQHEVEIPVDRTFTFADTKCAFEHLASADHLGKIMIEIEGDPK